MLEDVEQHLPSKSRKSQSLFCVVQIDSQTLSDANLYVLCAPLPSEKMLYVQKLNEPFCVE